MPLIEHLRELRGRLLICLLALIPGAVIGWLLYQPISDFLAAPICDLGSTRAQNSTECGPLTVVGLLSPLNLQVKVSLATGALLSAPVWLHQLWRFVTPGLYRNERRWGLAFLATSVPLFFAGAATCYLILPKATALLLSFTPDNIGNLLPYHEYLNLVLRLVFVFGLAFEIPVFVVLLNAAGLLPAARLRSWWRGIVLGVFVFAAVATPTGDPITMLALAVPLLALIGVAYGVSVLGDRRRARAGDEPDYEAMDDDETSRLDPNPRAADED